MLIEEIDYNEVLELRHSVLYPNMDIDYAKVENDELGIHLGVREQGVLIAVMSIFLEGRELQFRKLAVLPNFQKKGYGSFLLKWLISYAKEMKFERIWGNARLEALPFYEKLDFKRLDKDFTKNNIKYSIIEYLINEKRN